MSGAHLRHFTDSLGEAGFAVVEFGRSGGRDLDLAIIGPDDRCSTRLLARFVELMRDHEQDLASFTVMVRQDHWPDEGNSRAILHLLYYPSLWHLSLWELPSLVAHVADRAPPAVGEWMRSRRLGGSGGLPFPVPTRPYELARYQELLVANLVYLHVRHPAASMQLVARLYRYAVTHSQPREHGRRHGSVNDAGLMLSVVPHDSLEEMREQHMLAIESIQTELVACLEEVER